MYIRKDGKISLVNEKQEKVVKKIAKAVGITLGVLVLMLIGLIAII